MDYEETGCDTTQVYTYSSMCAVELSTVLLAPSPDDMASLDADSPGSRDAYDIAKPILRMLPSPIINLDL